MDWTQAVVVGVTVVAGFVTWGLNERSKRRFEDYSRREERYVQLVRSLPAFYVGSEDRAGKQTLLTEVNLCWLYGTDEVLRAAYKFLETVKTGANSNEEDQRLAAGDLLAAIRQDLLRRAPLQQTSVKPSEFQVLKVS